MTHPLVSSQWLKDNLTNSDLILLDASSSDNKAELIPKFANKKIKGAQHFDLKQSFSNSSSQFPNTFPSEEQFEIGCRSLGINTSSRIVIYDNLGIYTSPRVWWMFKTMGHKNVHVLDGGLPEWIRQGFETVEQYEPKNELGDFRAQLQPNAIKSLNSVTSNISEQKYLLIDARSEDRFNGTVEEPRKGLRSGHIPHSINLPYTSVLENGMYISESRLKKVFNAAGIDERPLTFSCGSGVTACILLIAAELVLKNDTAVYDGSWTEYASLIKEGL